MVSRELDTSRCRINVTAVIALAATLMLACNPGYYMVSVRNPGDSVIRDVSVTVGTRRSSVGDVDPHSEVGSGHTGSLAGNVSITWRAGTAQFSRTFVVRQEAIPARLHGMALVIENEDAKLVFEQEIPGL